MSVLIGHARAQTCGDPNGDGSVTVADAIQALRAAAELSTSCTDATCDMDGNGSLTAADGVQVLRAAVDLSATFGCLGAGADPFIEAVARSDGAFGPLTKIPLVAPAGAPETITIEPPSRVLAGSKISFTVAYAAGESAVAGAAVTELFVASRADGAPPTGSSFKLALDGDEGSATVHVDLRDDVQSSRIDFATGANGEVTGEVVSVIVIVVPAQGPTCGNRVFDPGEICEPPGSLCAQGFCDDTCVCNTGPDPVITPTPVPCGDGVRQGSEQCDGPDDANCEPPLDCRADGSCKCETPVCSNGIREGSEQCDGGDAAVCQGRPCLSSCLCAPPIPTVTPTPPPSGRFLDNGDGTVTDNQTGLQWEKKEAGASGENLDDPRDVDNRYKWTDLQSAFIDRLNQVPCFANHCDWRLPTVGEDGGEEELETIVDLSAPQCGTKACIAAIFGITADTRYWSGTTRAGAPDNAYWVNFQSGAVGQSFKSNSRAVRAVRDP